ncbi:hypothetical protein XENTR_v10018403 [Xenopus tropicalis]|nr:hypothetical protein XENTR_v10018403 [Xenopus tropicalis]|eukprot:XP_012822664.1 PREDICTED: pulmonary surfactant-associated protein A-like [Xenopus tropicalis]
MTGSVNCCETAGIFAKMKSLQQPFLLLAAICVGTSMAQLSGNCLSGLPGIPETIDRALQVPLLTINQRIAKLEAALNFEGKFHQVGGKIFATNGEQADFEASKLTCKKAGGRIATPMNEAENSALLSILKEQNKYAYLGVTEGVIPSIYLYLDGTPLSYSNWRKNEPNGKGKEKCVEMFTDGQWNDKACNQNRLTVCEF